jgi:hypothetical protein
VHYAGRPTARLRPERQQMTAQAGFARICFCQKQFLATKTRQRKNAGNLSTLSGREEKLCNHHLIFIITFLSVFFT